LTPVRVAFVHAPNPVYAELQNNGVLFMPVWAYTLAAHLPDDGRYALALHDMRMTREAEIAAADVFLYSGINQDYPTIVALRDTLARRYPAARHAIGGPLCWSFDQAGDIDKLAAFDLVLVGDGEDVIADAIERLASGRIDSRIIRRKDRFPIAEARPMHRPLLDATIGRYYGAVLEISRGCPFLCEFCDIRVLPDNNRPHNKSAELIVAEMDHLCRQGVNHFLLACDNFIGDPRWAEQVVDALLEWQARTGVRPALYTWLTINLYKFPALMRKMRRAGFDTVFIGIESFNSNSLLETAKVQNTAAGLIEAIREIQSFGFFIVGGLIFGFDSDGPDCFDITLNGLLQAGLLSGDPSLLTALPGTPLYRRMKLAGRLREVRYGLGGLKYQTNIRYLLPRETMVGGFRRFVDRLTHGEFQYARLARFFDNLERGNFVPLEAAGYSNLGQALKTIFRSPSATWQIVVRIAMFARRPSNLYWLARAVWLVARRPHLRGRWNYVKFWMALWTNVVLKYQGLRDSDFDIESVPEGFDLTQVLPTGYVESTTEEIPRAKIRAQQRYTVQALADVAKRRAAG
jgi:radical SAM superfamily enzyme YgiQ (UPF0313 family)